MNPASAGEVWDLLRTGRRFRSLGRKNGFRLLRWAPMAAADLVERLIVGLQHLTHAAGSQAPDQPVAVPDLSFAAHHLG